MIVIPRSPGGWWHEYVCPTHGVELGHVGLLAGVFPVDGAPCRHGCRWDTPAIRGGWTVLAHQACAAAADAPTLREYEEFYLALDEPMFRQTLTESVWAVSIGLAARRHGNPVPKLLRALADAAEKAREGIDPRSNYLAWFNAAGAVCSGGERWQRWQEEHVLAATYADGWEWEGSTYYHSFVLRAYELSLTDPPSAVKSRLDAMREVAALFGDAALHDGPYTEPGHAPPPHASAPLGSAIPLDLRPPPAPADPGSAVTLGAADEPAAGAPMRTFPDVGYAAVAHAGIRAIVDFGQHGGSHGHRDKLSLHLYPWQPDPGQVPYGHKGWREYYASTRAHGTFRIDDLEQAECAGYLVDERTFGCDAAYEGVRAVRRVTPIEGGLRDELTVSCDRPRKVTLQLRPAVPLEVDGMATRWLGDRVLTGRHECDADSEFMVFPGPGPADDPQRTMRHVDWTVYDTTAVTFRSEYRCLS